MPTHPRDSDSDGPISEPPAKRVRFEIHRFEDYWFRLGDVVLIADNKVAYKVHSDLLGRRSKVFEDLIGHDAPRPEDEETMDDCPVVHITDSPEDFTLFLSLIYNGWEFRKGEETPSWPIVKVMLVLGDKYDVPEFRDEGIRRLRLAFPQDMETWDRYCGIRISGNSETISVAHVTSTLGMPDLHAALLYSCLSVPITELLHGVGGSGDLVLRPDDLSKCLEVREVMPTLWFHYHDKLFFIQPPLETNCLNRHICRQVLAVAQSLATKHARNNISPAIAYDPLDIASWDGLLSEVEDAGMCFHCITFYEKRLLEMRQELRNSLTERFRL